MLYTSLNFQEFKDLFVRAGRGDKFSYEALTVLFDYYDNMEEPIECDVIAICCSWYEVEEKPSEDYFYLETSNGSFLVLE